MYRLQRIFLVLLLVSFSGQIYADSNDLNELFPLPENLKANVKFWIQVYAKYNHDQVIIHDNKNLEIIYQVVDLNDLFPNLENVSEKRKWKEIESLKDEYRDILRSLAKMNAIRSESLTERERFVYELFGADKNSSDYYQAAQLIRAQQGLRNHFLEGLKRSGRYMDFFVKTYEKYNLPIELTALPHVESSFNNSAYSKFGAAGLWQFTRGTGHRFLQINYTVDERFDPEKATEAAAKLLKHNYEVLGSWPLAITAYNHGVNGLKRAVEQLNTNDIGVIAEKYQSRQFQFASRNFYAEFLAASHVSKNYKTYFGDITLDEPMEFIVVELPYYIKFSTLIEKLKLSIEEIKELNPSLRSSVLKSQRMLPKGFVLRLPIRENFDSNSFYAQISNTERFDNQIESHWYEVEQGDNLKMIAGKFNTSINELIALNNDIEDIHKIYAGQIIRVPGDITEISEEISPSISERDTKPEIVSNASEIPTIASESKIETNTEDVKWYQVRAGDNLERIARKFNISVQDLMAINNIQDKNHLSVGQLVKLSSEEDELALKQLSIKNAPEPQIDEPIAEYTVTDQLSTSFVDNQPADKDFWHDVKMGDTLEKIASQYNVQLTDLIKINNIENVHKIQVGQTLIIPKIKPEPSLEIDETILADSNVKEYYLVGSGDNLEKIADELGVTVGELIQANKLSDRNKISVGQKLIIPEAKPKLASMLPTTFDQEKQSLKSDQQSDKSDDESYNNTYRQVKTAEPQIDKIYVMPEETLGHYADWLEVRTQELRNLNGFKYGQELQLGQQIKIIYSNISQEEFIQRRMEYHRGLEEDFFTSYRVDSVQTHKLKYGENLWYLCNELYEVPYWLLMKYNPNLNINRLQKDDEIVIPIITSKKDG